MLLPTPIGPFRLEPLRDLKRAWLWLTAPEGSRVQIKSALTDTRTEIRNLSDADLLLCIQRIKLEKSIRGFCESSEEARRRGLDPIKPVPQWVQAVHASGPSWRLAERVLRPSS